MNGSATAIAVRAVMRVRFDRERRQRLQEASGRDPNDEHDYDWRNDGGCTVVGGRSHGRDKQLAPASDWAVWLIVTGRGWGKTRTGAEWVREQIERHGRGHIALVGDTSADVRDVMIEDPKSGILSCSPPWNRPRYEPSKRRLVWPNGATATAYSAEDPEQLRGPQHDGAWCDELAKWKRQREAWDNLMFGLRIGDAPRCLVTTTPRPTKLMKELVARSGVVLVRGHTYENIDNLAPQFREQVIVRYEGTRTGRQELAGEILEDVEGAMWQQGWIDDARVNVAPELARVVIAVDPATTHGEDSDQTGIAAAGRGAEPCSSCRAKGYASDWYVLHAQGYRLSPEGWARKAIMLHEAHEGDRIIAERNNGGEMVEATLRHAGYLHTKTIVASRGKTVRAEPVAELYEQGRVHHVGMFAELEEQQTSFPVANELDDIVDAVVYAITELEGGGWILE